MMIKIDPSIAPTVVTALHDYANQLDKSAEALVFAKDDAMAEDFETRAENLRKLATDIEVES
jgi:hypothetical protein